MTDIGRSAGVSKASHETSEIRDLQVCPGLADMLQEPGRSSLSIDFHLRPDDLMNFS